MLTREIMGYLALAILWVNTLLVVGAAFGPLRDLLRRLKAMRTLGVLEGEVVDGTLAYHAVEQIGRKAADDADRKAILFHDRKYDSVVAGGRIKVDDDELTVGEHDAEQAEVWVTRDQQQQAGACTSDERFVEAYAASRKAKGFERTVKSEIASGARVWVVAERDGSQLAPPARDRMLIAAFDPRPWCRAKLALVILFMLAVMGASAGITLLVLQPPIFGTVSTIGGAIGLVYFLLVQPAGTAARDAVLVPSRAHLRGSWVES